MTKIKKNGVVRDMTPDELAEYEATSVIIPQDRAEARIREQRDDMLSKTDWVVTKAVEQNAADGLGIQVPIVWIQYRQALRDIPDQAGFPYKVTWPQEP